MNNESENKKQTAGKKRTSQAQTDAPDEKTIDEIIEEKIDRDLRDSFPASDPPGWTMGVMKRRPKKTRLKLKERKNFNDGFC